MSRPGLSMLSPSSWEFVQSELCGLEGVNLDRVSLDSNSHLVKSGICSRHCTPCPTPSSSGGMFSITNSPIESVNAHVLLPFCLITP